jgi:hypothetical protein
MIHWFVTAVCSPAWASTPARKARPVPRPARAPRSLAGDDHQAPRCARPVNALALRATGTDLLTVRIDLDPG